MFRWACHTISHMAPTTSWQISPDNGPQRRVQGKGSWDFGGWPVWASKLSFPPSCARTANWSEATLNTRRHSFASLFRGSLRTRFCDQRKSCVDGSRFRQFVFVSCLGLHFYPGAWEWWLSEPNLSTCTLVQLLKHNEKLKDAKERAQRRLQNRVICSCSFGCSCCFMSNNINLITLQMQDTWITWGNWVQQFCVVCILCGPCVSAVSKA